MEESFSIMVDMRNYIYAYSSLALL